MIISELNKIKAVKFGDVDIKKVYSGKYKVFPEEGGYFYVCHSSTGLIERFPVVNSVDWPTLVTENHTYGGLYSHYTGKGDYAKAIEAGTLDDNLFVDNKLQDINCSTYDGSVFGLKNRFNKDNAYTSVQIPIKNKIYYICEPLKEYFDNNAHVSVINEDKTIDSTYFIYAIDSANYNSIKFFGNDEFVANGNASGSLSLQNPATGETTTIKITDVNSSLRRGYVVYAEFKFDTPNVWHKINAQCVTCDNYIINYAKTFYVYTGDLTTDTFIIQDYPPTT
ncbi:hypothetical protein [uncultured Methanobrevibacter sp.]|uniref:hypothetical protein n=1 Tax=uncultured Methanobrevibacter sp. TaxID=253161 RepID=UPI0025D53680|nr:hypothetical protein [uncultured Methanobrevibacter sp.]